MRHHSSDDSEDGGGSRRRPSRRRRRQRDDSSSEEEGDRSSAARRRRHDSSDEEGDRGSLTRSRRKRHESSDDNENDRGRRRHDSSDESGDDDGGSRKGRGNSERRHRRRDSSDDDESDAGHGSAKRRHDDSDSSGGRSNGHRRSTKEKMSSGHSAGLQSASRFWEAESRLRRKDWERAEELADETEGKGETVYRNSKSGRRIDMDRKFREGRAKRAEREREEDKKRRLLNLGKVQREESEAAARERDAMKEKAFARGIDDNDVDRWKKDAIRAEDPMAAHARKKQAQRQTQDNGGGKPSKPIYKGPQPKPNRYGIRPGYRWDDIAHGNGFEDMVLARQFGVQRKKEEAHRWSTADM